MTTPAPTDAFVQLLQPDGRRVDNPSYPLDLRDEEQRMFYRDMVTVRRFDTEATALQRQGQLGLWAPSLGQEAAQVGSARALKPQDMAFPTYREHGVALCRGVDLLALLAMFRGVDLGSWDTATPKMHTYTIVLGTQTLHATGYAMGVAKDGAIGDDNGTATIAYLGDGATSEGDANEALIWAGVFNAPVVFFCQNNQYAISETNRRQTRAPIYRRGEGFGFPGVFVDGNDILACYAVTREALLRARRGEGPTLIEAYTYRIGAHTTSDDPTRYRDSSEVEMWRTRDPITRYRAYLEQSGIIDQDFVEEVDREADEKVLELRRECLALPDPDPLTMFNDVYPTGSAEVEAQRTAFASYQDSLEPIAGVR